MSDLARAGYQAAVEWGAAPNDDPNGPTPEGVCWNQLTLRGGKRDSASTAFLKPAMDSPCLTVRTGAHATRLVLDRSRRVTAVEYLRDGVPARCTVRREVLLTAGALESPKLLMLSGIGPADHVSGHGIPVEVDLAGVGSNLHDHPGVPVVIEAPVPVPFGPNQGSELGLFCKSSPQCDAPDIQFGFLNLAVTGDDTTELPGNAFMFYPSLLTPRSRGTVRLGSPSPFDHPVIDPGY